jgi:hypothetical protein
VFLYFLCIISPSSAGWKSNFSKQIYHIVYVLLGISPASDCGIFHIQPLKMDLTEGSETSAKHNLTPGKYPKEHIQYS